MQALPATKKERKTKREKRKVDIPTIIAGGAHVGRPSKSVGLFYFIRWFSRV
jgi:hypothetical protein